MIRDRYRLTPATLPRVPGISFCTPREPLSNAENRVLEFLITGYSDKEVALALGKSESTVRAQVRSILKKFAQPSRARLLAVFNR